LLAHLQFAQTDNTQAKIAKEPPTNARQNRNEMTRTNTTEKEGRRHNIRLAPFFCRRRNTKKREPSVSRCVSYKKPTAQTAHLVFLPTRQPTLKKPKELFFPYPN